MSGEWWLVEILIQVIGILTALDHQPTQLDFKVILVKFLLYVAVQAL